MTVGLLTVEFHLPEARSLKDKRMHLSRIKARLRNQHNVAVAEVDYQDKWQRSTLAIVTVASSKTVVSQTLESITREVEERLLPGPVLNIQTELLEAT